MIGVCYSGFRGQTSRSCRLLRGLTSKRNMHEILQVIGLSPDEITVYEYLLTSGARTAGDVSRHTSIKRGTAYNVLGDLVARGFARQFEDKGVMKFALEHPSRIREMLEARGQKLNEGLRSFDSALPALTSRWNLVYHRPAVRYYEGLSGLNEIYEDIIREGADILLIRSVYDDDKPDLNKLVQKQIACQVERGIKTRALTPIDVETYKTISEFDEARLVERRLAPEGELMLPGQVMIYGDKVAITDLKDSMVSTLIENRNVAETFKQLFEYMWARADMPRKKAQSV